MKSDSRAGLRIAKLSQLTQDPHNANKGTERGTAMIERSLRQYGAGRSILVDRKGRVIAGNKTLEQARAAGLRELLLVPSDGRKLIAVQRTDLDLNRDKHARELAIADNRAGELNLEWDSVILQELAKDMDLEPFFSARELSEIAVNGGGDEGPEPQLDRAEELRAKWNTAPGQIWRIPSIKTPRREHRLMCGDSTKAEDVRLLMDTARAGLMNTDPPYGIGYAALKDGMPGSGFRNIQARYGDIRNDDLNGPELQRFLEEMIRAAVPCCAQIPPFIFGTRC